MTNTTHTPRPPRRFNRNNLPPDHAAILGIAERNEEDRYELLAVVAAAARFTSGFGSLDQFDQLFVAQHSTDQDATEPAKCQSVPVTEDQHRTTVIFGESGFTRRVGLLNEDRCWVNISIRGKAPDNMRPEIIWRPLDEKTWLPTREMASKFPLPALGECWPMADQLAAYGEKNPEVWHLMVTAATVIGEVPPMMFPNVTTPKSSEMNFLQQRDAKLRAERSVARTQRMIERLPAEMREAFLAKLASSATRVQ